jgi:hypothetical protein
MTGACSSCSAGAASRGLLSHLPAQHGVPVARLLPPRGAAGGARGIAAAHREQRLLSACSLVLLECAWMMACMSASIFSRLDLAGALQGLVLSLVLQRRLGRCRGSDAGRPAPGSAWPPCVRQPASSGPAEARGARRVHVRRGVERFI